MKNTTIDSLKFDFKKAKDNAANASKRLDKIDKDVNKGTEAQVILQQIAEGVQKNVHRKISTAVTKCLNAVFADKYVFEIRFERKRGRTEAKLIFICNGVEVLNPLHEDSGGALDIASFGLRVAALVLAIPKRRQLLIMDEPFKFVSQNKRHHIRNMIETLADELGIQFVIVTHMPELEIGTVVHV